MENCEQRIKLLERQMEAMIDRYLHIATEYELLRLQMKEVLKKQEIDSRLDYLGRI